MGGRPPRKSWQSVARSVQASWPLEACATSSVASGPAASRPSQPVFHTDRTRVRAGQVQQQGPGPAKGDKLMRLLITICAMAAFCTVAQAQEVDWKKVDEVLGRAAAVGGDVHRYGFPRTDLNVTLDGVTIKPSLALGGWVAFKPMGNEAMVMGDLVLLETEVNPVMLKMIEGGLDITAVHNHLLRASPATFYMHVGGHGDPAKMAAVIHDALAVSKTPLSMPAAAPPPAIDLDTAQLDRIMEAKGQANGGVYQFNVPRRDPVSMDGMPM